MNEMPVAISAQSDEDVVRQLRDLGEAHPEVVAVVRGAELPPLFEDVAGVRLVSSDRELGRELARRFPARPVDLAAPPAVVVGDGDLARIVTAELVVRSAVPGEPLTLHCIGRDPEWAVSAMTEVGARGRLLWSQLPMRPLDVAHRVAEIVAAEAELPAYTDSAGPTVIVALEQAAGGLPVARAVAAALPTARVAVAVDEEGLWPTLRGVTQVARDACVAKAVTQGESDELLEALYSDVAWLMSPEALVTAPPVDLFGLSLGESGELLPLGAQPGEALRRLRLIVESLDAVFAAGGVERAGQVMGRPPVLSPGELTAMSGVLLDLTGEDATPEARLATLELALRLPTIAARAGMVLTRPHDRVDIMTFDQVEALAPLVHDAYQQISARTNNATVSPWAGVAWQELGDFEKSSNRAVLVGSAVYFAAEGLDWIRVDEPSIRAFEGQTVDRLAELEHRRWAVNQRANGRQSHKWSTPWSQLEAGQKSYDEHIVCSLPAILSAAGIEVVAA